MCMKIWTLTLIPPALLLAACGGGNDGPDATAQSCQSFYSAQQALVDAVTDGRGGRSKEQWDSKVEGIAGAIDTAGLTAEASEVKERISSVAQSVPADALDLALSRSAATGFNQASQAAARACDVAGSSGHVSEIPVNGFMRP